MQQIQTNINKYQQISTNIINANRKPQTPTNINKYQQQQQTEYQQI